MSLINIAEDVPAGLYSVSFQSQWKHPHIGKNALHHEVLSIAEDLPVLTIELELAQAMTYLTGNEATCEKIKIISISKLA